MQFLWRIPTVEVNANSNAISSQVLLLSPWDPGGDLYFIFIPLWSKLPISEK